MVDQVTVPAEENQEAPEGHEEAMASLADGEEVEENFDRPEWLPEKFNSPEDLANAYKNLEQKLSQGDTSNDEVSSQENEEFMDEAERYVESKGLDFGALSAEYAREGELSEGSYQALQDAGIPKTFVDDFINGQQARSELIQQQVYNLVGGQDTYDNMTTWAKENLSPEEVKVYNANVDLNNIETAKFAVNSLHARYQMANGSAPNLIQGQPTNATSSYNSMAQVTADMKDPRYQDDPSFRKQVHDKLANSNVMQQLALLRKDN